MEKQQAYLATLRQDRGVAEPQAQQQTAPVIPAAADAAKPVQNHSGPSVDELLKQFDARTSQVADTMRQAEAAKAEAAAREAAAIEREARLTKAAEDPVAFLSELNWTESEWQDFLAGGGKPDPTKNRLKELESKLEAMERQAKEREQAAVRAQEDQQIAAQLQTLPFSKNLATPAAVRQRQQELQQRGQPATQAHAMQSLENEFKTGLLGLLQNPEIAGILGLSVNKPNSVPAATAPTTLNSSFTSDSRSASPKNPAATDWKAKKAAFLEALAKQQRGG